MYYVYFLYLSNGNIYKGMTGRDINERYIEHQKGKVDSTKSYLPATLLGYEMYYLKSDAERRERFLKST